MEITGADVPTPSCLGSFLSKGFCLASSYSSFRRSGLNVIASRKPSLVPVFWCESLFRVGLPHWTVSSVEAGAGTLKAFSELFAK